MMPIADVYRSGHAGQTLTRAPRPPLPSVLRSAPVIPRSSTPHRAVLRSVVQRKSRCCAGSVAGRAGRHMPACLAGPVTADASTVTLVDVVVLTVSA